MNFEIFTVDERADLNSADSVLANLVIDGETVRPTIAAGEEWATKRAVEVYENPRKGEHRGVVVLTDDTQKWWIKVTARSETRIHVRTIKGECPVDKELERRGRRPVIEGDNPHISGEVFALATRPTPITLSEYRAFRGNSWEQEAIVPNLDDEALAAAVENVLANIATQPRRPAITYEQALAHVYAPEMVRRLGARPDDLIDEAYRLLAHLHHRGSLDDLAPAAYEQALALIERLRRRA